MAQKIQFTRNYHDESSDKGYQFEFYCDRCGTGYRTPFKASMLGMANEALEAASGIFGGLFGRAADLGQHARSASLEKAHDAAFVEAMEQLKPDFAQCPRCQGWVCRDKCWNTKRGLCKHCAPDLAVEMSAAQASRSVEEVWAHAKMSAEDKHLSEANWRETIQASCPKCEAPLASSTAKFCPECGALLSVPLNCPICQAKLQPNAKFCADCGAKV